MGREQREASKAAGMSSMTDVQVLLMFLFLDSKMAKQQLQKWELKFVTGLNPLLAKCVSLSAIQDT